MADLQAAEQEKQHLTSAFHAFLPNEPVSVGETWRIKKGVCERY